MHQCTPTRQCEPRAVTAGVELELIRTAGAELQSSQAMRDLRQALAARAINVQPEAQRILSWPAAMRSHLEERDPVAAHLRLATRCAESNVVDG